jgi:hypothetical protein
MTEDDAELDGGISEGVPLSCRGAGLTDGDPEDEEDGAGGVEDWLGEDEDQDEGEHSSALCLSVILYICLYI